MNPQTYLTVLTFVGLVVGSVGGLISQLTKTSVEIDGTMRKRLTSPGRWALAISLLGFGGSFASEMLKSSLQAQERAQAKLEAGLKAQKEKEDGEWKNRSAQLQSEILTGTKAALKESIDGFKKEQEAFLKTKLAIAESRQRVLTDNLMHETRLYGRLSDTGTPLVTMTIELTIDNVPTQIRQQVVKGINAAKASTSEPWYEDLSLHHNTGPEDDLALPQSVMDQRVIQPFIDWVGAEQFHPDLNWKDKVQTQQAQGILAFSLDKHFSALVCVGWVSGPDIFRKEVTPEGSSVTETSLPSGVLIGDEIEFRLSWLKPSGSYKRTKAIRPPIKVEVVKNSLVLTIEITRLALDDSLIRYAQNSFTTAALPDTVGLFSWTPSSDGHEGVYGNPQLLPFDPMEVHSGIPDLDRQRRAKSSRPPVWLRRMRLRIIPNGIKEISKTYDLTFSAADDIMEGPRDDDPRGYVRLWHGRAVRH